MWGRELMLIIKMPITCKHRKCARLCWRQSKLKFGESFASSSIDQSPFGEVDGFLAKTISIVKKWNINFDSWFDGLLFNVTLHQCTYKIILYYLEFYWTHTAIIISICRTKIVNCVYIFIYNMKTDRSKHVSTWALLLHIISHSNSLPLIKIMKNYDYISNIIIMNIRCENEIIQYTC